MPISSRELKILSIRYSPRELPWDFEPFLYRGYSKLSRRDAARRLTEGRLSSLVPCREALIVCVCNHIRERAVEVSERTLKGDIKSFDMFSRYCDRAGLDLSIDSAEKCFVRWINWLAKRVRARKCADRSVYCWGVQVAAVLGGALEVPAARFVTGAHLGKFAKKRKARVGKSVSDLTAMHAFGAVLRAISDALSPEALAGQSPIRIRLPSGAVHEELFRRRKGQTLDGPSHVLAVHTRIEAELLIFIAQTGMNIGQAIDLSNDRFSFRTTEDGYEVIRSYKGRRHGEVAFRIFKGYRDHFDRYTSWIRTTLGDEESRLFPFRFKNGERFSTHAQFFRIKRILDKITEAAFFSPRYLRKARINWFMRKSNDVGLVSAIAQSGVPTLFESYLVPNHQVAAVEISRFFARAREWHRTPGFGACAGAEPLPMDSTVAAAAVVDCVSPAGCLFCAHYRDIDSLDHFWSLASYRYLKSLELCTFAPTPGEEVTPVRASIDAVTARLTAIKNIDAQHAILVDEAESRMAEAFYHPRWSAFIDAVESCLVI